MKRRMKPFPFTRDWYTQEEYDQMRKTRKFLEEGHKDYMGDIFEK